MLNNDQPGPKASKQKSQFNTNELVLEYLRSLSTFHESGQASQQAPKMGSGNGMWHARSSSSTQSPSSSDSSQAASCMDSASSSARGSSQELVQADTAAMTKGSGRFNVSGAEQDSWPIHFYIMGHQGHWQACASWPPPAVDHTMQLFMAMPSTAPASEHTLQETRTLSEAMSQHGLLRSSRQPEACRWEHRVSKDKYMKAST